MRAIFEPLKYLTVEQLDRIDPWTAVRLNDTHATGERCIAMQAFDTDEVYLPTIAPSGLPSFHKLGTHWDLGCIPREELADAIDECLEALTVKIPERVKVTA
jgi:hypothetical protein